MSQQTNAGGALPGVFWALQRDHAAAVGAGCAGKRFAHPRSSTQRAGKAILLIDIARKTEVVVLVLTVALAADYLEKVEGTKNVRRRMQPSMICE